MNRHLNPYSRLDDSAFWSRSVSDIASHEVHPITSPRFKFSYSDQIISLGSCFAQHVARHIQNKGLNYLVTEPGGSELTAENARALGYGIFSARYGNIYTSRQALQLVERSLGIRSPEIDAWRISDNSWIDPFRPNIMSREGFASRRELHSDRQDHFNAVRTMLREADIMIYTLGLTEAWQSIHDEFVVPFPPGVFGCESNARCYEFINFDIAQTVVDLSRFVDLVRDAQPNIRVMLSVSPVPLVATYSGSHVLCATTYSKSVLRVAVSEVMRTRDWVDYFPSYEIVTGIHSGNSFFEDDLRSVAPTGIARVMEIFDQYYVDGTSGTEAMSDLAAIEQEMNQNYSVICDEEMLENSFD